MVLEQQRLEDLAACIAQLILQVAVALSTNSRIGEHGIGSRVRTVRWSLLTLRHVSKNSEIDQRSFQCSVRLRMPQVETLCRTNTNIHVYTYVYVYICTC